MRLLALLAAIAAVMPAQTRVNANRPTCRGTQAQIYAELPAKLGSSTVLVPVCVALGAGFVLDTLTDPPTLRPSAQATPWLAVERLDLTAYQIAADQPEVTVTLSRTPVEGSALLAILQGRPFGMVDAVAAASGRQVSLVLPAGPRPFQAGDAVVLVYLTTDQRVTPTAR